jgi:deoxyribodipyrimidine photo-lyase
VSAAPPERRAPAQVVWFKRDLRVRDHAPLAEAARRGPVLGLTITSPRLLSGPDADAAHLDFVHDSLLELRASLQKLGVPLVFRTGGAVEVLAALHAEQPIDTLWSHQEIGLWESFQRDLAVGRWARGAGVRWVELPQGGVRRPNPDRDDWAADWGRTVGAPLVPVPHGVVGAPPPAELGAPPEPEALGVPRLARVERQAGGEAAGWETLRTFFVERGAGYRADMASPLSGWTSCSRLSPHLAFGTLSARQALHATWRREGQVARAGREGEAIDPRWGPSLQSFHKRLRWRCHFMQRLEDFPKLDREPINPAYGALRAGLHRADRWAAFARAETGFPFIDACLRCVMATGWLNFRARAMLVSVATWTMHLDWRAVGQLLARAFLDYEPGIHWAQVQMQAGLVGINTPRLYNPTKQGEDHDPEGVFIRRWVPELARLPRPFVHRPWETPPLLGLTLGFVPGRDYPLPVVDPRATQQESRAELAAVRADPAAWRASADVLARHGSRRRPPPRGR